MINGLTKQERAFAVLDAARTIGPLNTPLASEVERRMRGSRSKKCTRAYEAVCMARSATGNPWRHQ